VSFSYISHIPTFSTTIVGAAGGRYWSALDHALEIGFREPAGWFLLFMPRTDGIFVLFLDIQQQEIAARFK
jgi:hypothetical protein